MKTITPEKAQKIAEAYAKAYLEARQHDATPAEARRDAYMVARQMVRTPGATWRRSVAR